MLDELGFDLALLGVLRHELHRLPRVVLREAIANAVAHRSYAPTAAAEAVRIEIRPDRVVVRSPGGLPDGVSLDLLALRSVPRNVLLIRTLRFFGIAEDAGRGVRLMRDHMALNLMAPASTGWPRCGRSTPSSPPAAWSAEAAGGAATTSSPDHPEGSYDIPIFRSTS